MLVVFILTGAVVEMAFGMNGTLFVISKTSTPKCTSHLGHGFVPSEVLALIEAASRIRTDVRLAVAWERKHISSSKDC